MRVCTCTRGTSGGGSIDVARWMDVVEALELGHGVCSLWIIHTRVGNKDICTDCVVVRAEESKMVIYNNAMN